MFLGLVVVFFSVQFFLLLRYDNGGDEHRRSNIHFSSPFWETNPHPTPLQAISGNKTMDNTKNGHDDLHIVFSTDCSGYQHWQSIALWYSAQAVGQRGPITRIASGCTPDQQTQIQSEWTKIDKTTTAAGHNRFRVHFSPSYSLQKGKYKYSNKPGGIRHFLANAQPPLQEDTIVCLLDPDMLLLKPLTPHLISGNWSRRTKGKRQQQVEYVDNDGVARTLRVASLLDNKNKGQRVPVPDRVRVGHPAGQHFGIGGAWARASSRTRPAWQNFSKAYVCGEGSPCTTTTLDDANSNYAAGPVYLASVQDWRRIAESWWLFVPRVHKQYPHLLAEMYGFTMAVANLTLPWSLMSHYMVSDPGTMSPTEAWSWVDDLILAGGNTSNPQTSSNVCAGADSTTTPLATRNRNAVALPTTLHYCQTYKQLQQDGSVSGDHVFAKRKIPHDFFRCTGGEPLPFDAAKITTGLGANPSLTELRTAFMLCHVIPIVNSALASYKRDVCGQVVVAGRD
jgi:hypothetical protein